MHDKGEIGLRDSVSVLSVERIAEGAAVIVPVARRAREIRQAGGGRPKLPQADKPGAQPSALQSRRILMSSSYSMRANRHARNARRVLAVEAPKPSSSLA